MANTPQNDFYISVDVETAGPNPSQYSLLTIGACTLGQRPRTFYIELKPINNKMTPEAFEIHHLDIKRLVDRGIAPPEAMASFADWLESETPPDHRPVFVAFNAAFDWMFICDYFHRFLGRNPFGHAALDIKALYMGLTGGEWNETSFRVVSTRFLPDKQLTHHALRDALDQAEIFQKISAQSRQQRNQQ